MPAKKRKPADKIRDTRKKTTKEWQEFGNPWSEVDASESEQRRSQDEYCSCSDPWPYQLDGETDAWMSVLDGNDDDEDDVSWGDPWDTHSQLLSGWLPEDPWAETEVEGAGASASVTSEDLSVDEKNLVPGSTPHRRDCHLEAGAKLLSASSVKGKPVTHYEINGSSEQEIQKRLGAGCRREGCCKAGCKPGAIQPEPMIDFLRSYWGLTDEERGHLMRVACAQPESEFGTASVPSYHILGKPVCFPGMVRLMGTSEPTVRKLLNNTPDLRRKEWSSHGRTVGRSLPSAAVQSMKCHTFFQQLHQSAAAPDPGQDCGTSGASGASDPYDWSVTDPLTYACHGKVLGLPVRSWALTLG